MFPPIQIKMDLYFTLMKLRGFIFSLVFIPVEEGKPLSACRITSQAIIIISTSKVVKAIKPS